MAKRTRTAWAATIIVVAACIGTTELASAYPHPKTDVYAVGFALPPVDESPDVPHRDFPHASAVALTAATSSLTATATAKVIKTYGLAALRLGS